LRKIFEDLAERPDHLFCVVALAYLPVDMQLHIDIAMVVFTDYDVRTHRRAAVEVFRQIITDGSALRPTRPAVTNAPVMEQRHPPDILIDVSGVDILTALADHNRNLSLVVEAFRSLGIRNLIVGSGDLMRIFPKSPLSLFPCH